MNKSIIVNMFHGNQSIRFTVIRLIIAIVGTVLSSGYGYYINIHFLRKDSFTFFKNMCDLNLKKKVY